MKLSHSKSDYLGIQFETPHEAHAIRPAVQGELGSRQERDEFNRQIAVGLSRVRRHETIDPIQISIPLTRLQPVVEYMIIMFDRHPSPWAKDVLSMAYEQLFMVLDELDRVDVGLTAMSEKSLLQKT